MTINIALIGLGYWGPNLARNLASVPGVRLHTLCDSRADRLQQIGRDYPGIRLRTDLAEVLSDADVTAVVVATPVHTHFEIASAALRAGKHLLVEKPLARTTEECRKLIDMAEAGKLTLMAGHVFLYNAAVRKVREYIDSGELGDIHYVCSQRLNLGIVRKDVNALWNFGPHDLSIINYWLGAGPSGVVARGYSYLQPGVEDVVFMSLDYPRGVGANVHISWLDPRKVRAMTIVGSRKMVVYDDVNPDARVTVYDKGFTKSSAEGSPLGSHRDFAEFQLLLRAGDITIPRIDFKEPLQLECRHFADCIRTGAPPVTGGEEALRVVKALEAAQRSLEQRGQWTAVPT